MSEKQRYDLIVIGSGPAGQKAAIQAAKARKSVAVVESETGGPLVGDSTARQLILDLRSAISTTVNDGSVEYKTAGSIGISLQRDGTFLVNETTLREALESDFGSVTDLLLSSGSALDPRVSVVGTTSQTVADPLVERART